MNPINELVKRHQDEVNRDDYRGISTADVVFKVARAMAEIMTPEQWEVLSLRTDMRELFENCPHLAQKRVILQQPFWLS